MAITIKKTKLNVAKQPGAGAAAAVEPTAEETQPEVVTASVQSAAVSERPAASYKWSVIWGVIALVALAVLVGLQLVENDYYKDAILRYPSAGSTP